MFKSVKKYIKSFFVDVSPKIETIQQEKEDTEKESVVNKQKNIETIHQEKKIIEKESVESLESSQENCIKIWQNINDMPDHLKRILIESESCKNVYQYQWISFIPFNIFNRGDPNFTYCSHFGEENILTLHCEYGVLRFSFFTYSDLEN
jgi:hypothetical protein